MCILSEQPQSINQSGHPSLKRAVTALEQAAVELSLLDRHAPTQYAGGGLKHLVWMLEHNILSHLKCDLAEDGEPILPPLERAIHAACNGKPVHSKKLANMAGRKLNSNFYQALARLQREGLVRRLPAGYIRG